jgi:hypothetical protein
MAYPLATLSEALAGESVFSASNLVAEVARDVPGSSVLTILVSCSASFGLLANLIPVRLHHSVPFVRYATRPMEHTATCAHLSPRISKLSIFGGRS